MIQTPAPDLLRELAERARARFGDRDEMFRRIESRRDKRIMADQGLTQCLRRAAGFGDGYDRRLLKFNAFEDRGESGWVDIIEEMQLWCIPRERAALLRQPADRRPAKAGATETKHQHTPGPAAQLGRKRRTFFQIVPPPGQREQRQGAALLLGPQSFKGSDRSRNQPLESIGGEPSLAHSALECRGKIMPERAGHQGTRLHGKGI